MSEREVLTLKYRPQTFDEVLVQEHVTRTLKKAIERDRLANAYLFAGPRGVGKTTTARILAKSLNCLSFDRPTTTPCNKCGACTEITGSRSMDVLEIDGASNRGINQVRELRENIKYAPSSLRYKLYIIDEVHMLTNEAFNALLKTLEEPPAHARFIFATTEAHKVPATIISRCQRFDFRKATTAEITDRLRWLADREKIKASDEALVSIARRADGAIRDGESVLEQLATYRPEGIELGDVGDLLGLVPSELFFDFVDLVLARDIAGLLRFLDELSAKGYDLLEFHSGLVEHFRNIMLVHAGAPTDSAGLLKTEKERLAGQADRFGRADIIRSLELLIRTEEDAKHSQVPRAVFEYLAMEMARLVPGEGDPKPAPSSPRPEPKPTAPRPAKRKPGPARKKPAASGDDPVLERMRRILGDVEAQD